MPVAGALRRVVRSRAPARPVAVARMVVAGAALVKAADLIPVLLAVTGGGVLRLPYGPWTPPLSPGGAALLGGVWVMAGTAFLVGWRTRWAGALLVAAMTAVLSVDQQLYSNHFYLLIVLSFLLTIAGSGAALSLDARRHGERGFVDGWPVTLLKVQLSIVYGYAVVAKLNLVYVSGSVLNVYWNRTGLFALPDAVRRVEVMAPLALLALMAEIALAFGMWVPRTRHATFALGFLLHGAIILTMGSVLHLSVFAALMFALYLLFLDAGPASRRVAWDDRCAFCASWVRWLRRLDWLRVFRFEPAGGGGGGGGGGGATAPVRTDAGFAAVRSVLEHLPVSFLWAPLLRFPPIALVGERAFEAVAGRRGCHAALTVEPEPAAARERPGVPAGR